MSKWQLIFEGQTVAIPTESEFIVGKNPDALLVMTDPTISREHLALRVDGASLQIRDLNSKNGTWLDDIPMEGGRVYSRNTDARLILANSKELVARKVEMDISPINKAEQEDTTSESIRETCRLVLGLAKEEMLENIDLNLESAIEKVIRENAAIAGYKEIIRNEYIDFLHIEKLLESPESTEILINGPGEVWSETDGELVPEKACFYTEEGLQYFVNQKLGAISRKIDRMNPYVCARLPDGSRITVMSGSIVHSGTHVSIRKFNTHLRTLHHLVAAGSFGIEAETILRRLVKERKNLVICGGTGSGKTTLLTALLGEVSESDRVICIEDTSEIFVNRKNFIRCESRQENAEGLGAITIRDLLRNSLRMRPDRLVLGECRGEETIDLLQALNTGHAGSMSTVHANSTREAISRLELLCLLAKERMDPLVARKFIANSLEFIVHVGREAGQRKLQSISRVSGVEAGQILLETIYDATNSR